LRPIEFCKAGELCGHFRVLPAERLLIQSQRALIETLRFGILGLGALDLRQACLTGRA